MCTIGIDGWPKKKKEKKSLLNNNNNNNNNKLRRIYLPSGTYLSAR
jgi:hypothetical protein